VEQTESCIGVCSRVSSPSCTYLPLASIDNQNSSLIKLVNLAARGLTIIKNIERLTSSMKLSVASSYGFTLQI
jgi:hypothetical protein